MPSEKRTSIATAADAWGDAMPDWVLALAEECDRRGSQAEAARFLGYSGATINQVLHGKYGGDYGGDLEKVAGTVRGKLLAQTVDCPVVGELRRDVCLREQVTPLHSGDPLRFQFFRACKTCPNASRNRKGGTDGQ